MSSSIVLTVVGDDRPGIVESLSTVLAKHGGNWAESNMMTLAGKFAGILLAELPAENVEALRADLHALQAEGLKIVTQLAGAASDTDRTRQYSIELVGQDRPGIVREITGVLKRHGVNVGELETRVQSASMSGERLFLANAVIWVPPEALLESLQDELEALANELMVDIRLAE
jgi:glycine cleavage system regulatory protein